MVESMDAARFGLDTPAMTAPVLDLSSPQRERERELAWKLHELLSSPLGEGVARILEESYRLLPQKRSLG
jgi:hypothetical protein